VTTININRSRYTKKTADWLDDFIGEQIRDDVEVVTKVGDVEKKSTKHLVVPEKLIALIEHNELNFPKVIEQIREGAHGAVGRGRMILKVPLRRKAVASGRVFTAEGEEVEVPHDYVEAHKAHEPAPAEAPSEEAHA
jgi:hypothetical protein